MDDYKIPLDWQEGGVPSIIAVGKYLTKRRAEMRYKDFVQLVSTELGGSDSSANKLMAIAAHPIISDPRYADKLPKRWALLYELQLCPTDKIVEALQNGSLLKTTKYDIWNMRGRDSKRTPRVRMVPAESTPTRLSSRPISKFDIRTQIKVPAGTNLVDWVRSGMKIEQDEGITSVEASRRIGLGNESYRLAKFIIALSDRTDLNAHDTGVVKNALEGIQATAQIRRHFEEVRPIVEKIWGSAGGRNQHTEKAEQRRIDNFLNAVVIIYDACSRIVDIQVPHVSNEEIDTSIEQLIDAKRALTDLIERLNKERV